MSQAACGVIPWYILDMARKITDVPVGSRYGRLTVVGYANNSKSIAKLVCDCGKPHAARASAISSGSIKSCGCLRNEKSRERFLVKNLTHGLRGTPEYSVWDNIKQRCFNPRHKAYINYGGRGILMCQEWASSFMAFLDHVGYRPSRLHSIDRIDNDGDYEPGNVKWSTKSEQAMNRRERERNPMGQYISNGQRNHSSKQADT
jgi:hypothetical protein